MKKAIYGIIVIALLATEVALVYFRKSVAPEPASTQSTTITPEPLPTATTTTPTEPVNNSNTSVTILNAVNLDVPFTPQAPTANWDAFHEEACEEASAVMVFHYFKKTSIGSTDDVEKELQAAAAWERTNVGTDVSIPAKDAVRMLREHFKLSAKLLDTVTADSLKKELSAGHLVILPAQGQFLHNPNFKQPGPRYHMLVVRGYDGSGAFITNDPGTKKGEKYPYSPEVLLTAVHDWNGGDVENGAKVAIVVDGVL